MPLLLLLLPFSPHLWFGASRRDEKKARRRCLCLGIRTPIPETCRRRWRHLGSSLMASPFPASPPGAKLLGLKSPIPFKWIKYAMHRLEYGMNFAYGGTGVFDTLVAAPNMTTQIDILEKLIKDSVYTKKDLESSLFLVSVAGNDYAYYIATGGTFAGLPAFSGRLMNQLVADLKRIRGLGAKRIAVTSLPPLGCLPRSTAEFSFKQCNGSANLGASYHNSLLQNAVAELNKETKASSYVVLDLYTSFSDIFQKKQGNS
nr:GDSL esterase/lipase At5g03610-like [Ipomoea batatas]